MAQEWPGVIVNDKKSVYIPPLCLMANGPSLATL